MRKLICADLQRVLQKPGFWFFTVLILGINCVITVMDLKKGGDFSGLAYMFQFKGTYSSMSSILSLLVFSVVYCDEFRSMSFITVIGRGLSRQKLVYAKLIDAAVLTLLLFALEGITMIVIGAVMCEPMTSNETGLLLFTIARYFFESLIAISLTSIFIYITEKVPVSMFFLIVLQISSYVIQSLTSGLTKELAMRLYFTEILSNTWVDFVIGAHAKAIVTMLLCFLCYISLSLVLIRITFGKKELNF